VAGPSGPSGGRDGRRSVQARPFDGATPGAEALRLRAILDACPDPIVCFDSALRLEYANRRASLELGPVAVEGAAPDLHDLGMPVDLAKRVEADVRHVLLTGEHVDATYDVTGPSGRRAYEARLTPELDRTGRVTHVVVTTRDVGPRLDAEAQLRSREEQLRALLDGSPDLILRFDRSGSVVFANRAAIRATGRRLDALLGRRAEALGIAPEVAHAWDDAVARVLRTGEPHTVEYQVGGPYGPRWYEARVVPELGLDGTAEHVVVTVRDTTEQRDALTELTQQALQDPLTGLPNRRALLGQLAHVVTVGGNTQVAVLLLDLDRLKLVNDSLGHAVGDELLVTVARKLETCIRAGDLLARLGGDEFAIVLSGAPTEEVAAAVAKRILTTLRRGDRVNGHELITTASIGIAVAAGSGASPDQLLLEADTALYAAKRRGRNRFEFFNEDLRARAKERLDLETGLRHALEDGSLVVHYQPEVDLRTGEVVGIEALLRWQHPTRGLLRAGSFLHIVEASGLALEVGARVLSEVCAQAARWRQAHPHRRLPVRMNVSPVQLMDAELAGEVLQALQDADLQPEDLCLELTESALLHGDPAVEANLQTLHDAGVSLALDDFGIGYASLASLRRIPASLLKIDRSFVADIADVDDRRILAGIIALAGGLGLTVVAEGVEEADHVRSLLDLGCRRAQGHLIARPAPAEDLEPVLLHGVDTERLTGAA